MTHEELKEHKGTVWSYAGFTGLHEYEYIGAGRLPVYGTFKRVATGETICGIQVASCFPTKRAAIEHKLAGSLEYMQFCQGQINELCAELVAMGD